MFQQILRPIQAQHTSTSPSLAQTMNLLHLTTDELRQQIEGALAQNPALEVIESLPHCPACNRPVACKGLCGVCAARQEAQTIVFTSPLEYAGKSRGATRDPYGEIEAPEAEEIPGLAVHLLRQISPELEKADRAIAAHLLTALDEDGLLQTSPGEIAAYFHIPLSRVEAVRRLIQRATPLGCGSRTSQEALLSQCEHFSSLPPAVTACLEHLEWLGQEKFAAIAQQNGFSTPEIESAARFIRQNLNPYPARAWWGQATRQVTYQTPDVIFQPLERNGRVALVVEIFLPYAGQLRINPLYRQVNQDGEWRADLEQARQLIKSLRHRQTAFEMLLARLAALQRDFILHGENHLRPLTRARLAEDLLFHESTISRAVAAKTAQLPNGHIIPLSRFFEKNRSVRSALKTLVAEETRPLSDDELAAALTQLGYPVARRTIAKYRSMEGILPASQRKHTTLRVP